MPQITPQNAPATNRDTSATTTSPATAVTVFARMSPTIAPRRSGLRRMPRVRASAGIVTTTVPSAHTLMN